MLGFSKAILKSLGYSIGYVVLSILMMALSTLISREIVLGISDCSGMRCLGEGFLTIIMGISFGLLTSTIIMFLIYLKLEIRYEIRGETEQRDDKRNEKD